MIKKKQSLITFIVSLAIGYGPIYGHQETTLHVKPLSEKEIAAIQQKPITVAWDLFDVAILRDRKKIAREALTHPYIFQAIKQSSWALIRDFYYMKRNHGYLSGENFALTAEKHNNKILATIIRDVSAQNQPLNPLVVSIMKLLHNLGVKQVIASDLTTDQMRILQHMYPTLFGEHAGIFDFKCSQLGIIKSDQDGYTMLQRPNPQMYDQLFEKNRCPLMIIDDNKHNIKIIKESQYSAFINAFKFENSTQKYADLIDIIKHIKQ